MMQPLFLSQKKIYTVTELNQEIKRGLESSYYDICVEGEISNFAFPNKKHIYFTLKDNNSVIRIAFFENSIRLSGLCSAGPESISALKDGVHVYVNGFVSTYDKRSEYQIIAKDVMPVKEGSLLIAFEQLKKKLEGEGLFDETRKKKIPLLPGKIGLITSKSGAVIKDIIKILNRRFGSYRLILRNVPVQGSQAPVEICNALEDLHEFGVDVIIIARGGGSFEDLACFNDETLAYKIYNCKIPVISAVGHQTDYTICDFVSDVRAATPTHAAEIVILDKKETIQNILLIKERIKSLLENRVNIFKRELELTSSKRLFKWPRIIINKFWQDCYRGNEDLKNNINSVFGKNKKTYEVLNQKISPSLLKRKLIIELGKIKGLSSNLVFAQKAVLDKKRAGLSVILEKLKGISPVTILERGYSITRQVKSGKLLKDIEAVNIGDLIETVVKNGKLYSKVTEKQ